MYFSIPICLAGLALPDHNDTIYRTIHQYPLSAFEFVRYTYHLVIQLLNAIWNPLIAGRYGTAIDLRKINRSLGETLDQSDPTGKSNT